VMRDESPVSGKNFNACRMQDWLSERKITTKEQSVSLVAVGACRSGYAS